MTALKKETQKQVNSHLITDDLEIIGIFKAFAQRKEKLWAWQQKGEGEQRRVVHYALVKKVDALRKSIEFCPNNIKGFNFDPDKAVYLYSKRRSIALKLKMREYDKQFIIIGLPKQLNLVKGDFLNNIELIERENEKDNAHKRELPRLLAKRDQMVSLQRLQKDQPIGRLEVFALHDISQGGMSFITYDPADFTVGEYIVAKNIDNKPLSKSLEGKVVSIRQLQESEDEFKIGISFKAVSG